jgi:hypothetical protein
MEGAVIHSSTAGNDENVPCLGISEFTLKQATTVQREEQRYNSTFSLTLALVGDGLSTQRLGSFTPGNERRYLLYRRLGWSRASLEWCEKFRPHRNSILGPSIL